MNATQLSRSTLLNKLREFYALVVQLKQDVHQSGDDLTVDRVQGELRTFMDDQLRALGGDDVGYHLYDAMRYVMVALADDQFLHMDSDWSGKQAWLGDVLEKQIFGTQRAGAAFFDNIDEILASRDKSKEEVATAYLIALVLGFKGRFRGSEEDQLVSYRERLAYFVGLKQAGAVDPGQPIFPDAYAHTMKDESAERLPNHKKYYWLLAFAFIGYLAVAHAVWYAQTNEIRSVVTVIQQAEG